MTPTLKELVTEMDALNLRVIATFWLGGCWFSSGDSHDYVHDANLSEFIGDNGNSILATLGLPPVEDNDSYGSAVVAAVRAAGKAGFIVIVEDATPEHERGTYIYTETFGTDFQQALRAFYVEGAVYRKELARNPPPAEVPAPVSQEPVPAPVPARQSRGRRGR